MVSARILIVFVTFVAIQFASPVLGQEPKSGEHCEVSAQVSCRLNDGTRRRCGALKYTPYEECGEVDLTWTYRYCNLNFNRTVTLRPTLTVPLLHTMDISDITNDSFDKSPMKVGACRQYSVDKVVDSCEKHTTVASLKIQGHVSGMQNVEGYFCYAYDWMKQRVGMPPPEPTPESVVSGIPGPNIDLSLACMYESKRGQGYDTGCHKLQDYEPSNKYDCVVPVEYSYLVQSLSSNDIQLQAIVDEGTNNLVDVTRIESVGQFIRKVYRTINVCRRNGGKVVKKAIAIATNLPGTLSDFDREEKVVLMPELVSKFRVSSFECFYKGILCEEFIRQNSGGCFSGEVMYKYEVENIGLVCNSIMHVGVKFGMDGDYSALVLGERSCSGGKRSCPGDFWIFTENRFIDTCNTDVVPISAEVEVGPPTDPFYDSDMNENRDDDHEEMDPSEFTTTTTTTTTSTVTTTTTTTETSYWRIIGGQVEQSQIVGNNIEHDERIFDVVEPPTAPPAEIKLACTTKASELVLQYNGKNCAGGNRRRRRRKVHSTGGKGSRSSDISVSDSDMNSGFQCNDYGSLSSEVDIEVTSGNQQKIYVEKQRYKVDDKIIVKDNDGLNRIIEPKAYACGGVLAQRIMLNLDYECLEGLVGRDLGSFTLVSFKP